MIAIDPLCKMEVEIETAQFKTEHNGQTYYFCASGCQHSFEEQPEKYLAENSSALQHHPSETGHVAIGLATFLAAVGLIVLTLGAVGGDHTLAWIGGIGAAVLLLVQFLFMHAEFRNILARLDAIEAEKE